MTPPAGGRSDDAMHRALNAGMPLEMVAVLLAARRHWWAANSGHRSVRHMLTVEAAEVVWRRDLDAALAHPAAPVFDGVFVAAMRRDRGIR